MWGMVIGAGLSLLQGALGGKQQAQQAAIQAAQQQANYIVANAQANAQNALSQNNAIVQNQLMASNNQMAGVSEQFSMYLQSLNNQRAAKSTAQSYNQLQETIGRYSDDYVRGSIQTRLAAAEQLGRATAETAAAGVGGSTSQLINRTMRLQAGMVDEEARIGNRTQMWEFAKQRAGLTDILNDASTQLIQRDMTGYQYGDAYATSVVGPAAPVGGSSVNSTQSILNGMLGAASTINWANVGQSAKDIYSSLFSS